MTAATDSNATTPNELARNFRTGSLLLFALPSMAMMLCLTLYTLADGFFIARFVGETALSALNMVNPMWGFIMAVGIMLAGGGSAMAGQLLGRRRVQQACRILTALVLLCVVLGVLFALACYYGQHQLIKLLGASPLQEPYCRAYLVTLMAFAPAFLLQLLFQTFFVTAGKPQLGFLVSVLAGLVNGGLDYLFMGPLQMGLGGAALATGCGGVVCAVSGCVFFCFPNKELHFARPQLGLRRLLKICSNGASEMVSNLAMALSCYLYNIAFLELAGEAGVAALVLVYYFEFVFTAVFFGYAQGVSPVISYKYGANDHAQLRLVIRRSLAVLAVLAAFVFALSLLSADTVLGLFAERGDRVFTLAQHGFVYYAVSFLFVGLGIFASAAFTALSNGVVSALISGARLLVLLPACILILPRLWGLEGLWSAISVAEFIGMLLGLACLFAWRKKYGY